MISLLAQAFGTNLLYIDPSSVSILLTSITAIVVACGAAIIIAIRTIKKKVNKVLHIDENAKKEVEDDLVISDDLKEGEAGEQPAEETPAEEKEEQPAEEASEKAPEENAEVKEAADAAKPKKKSKKSN